MRTCKFSWTACNSLWTVSVHPIREQSGCHPNPPQPAVPSGPTTHILAVGRRHSFGQLHSALIEDLTISTSSVQTNGAISNVIISTWFKDLTRFPWKPNLPGRNSEIARVRGQRIYARLRRQNLQIEGCYSTICDAVPTLALIFLSSLPPKNIQRKINRSSATSR